MTFKKYFVIASAGISLSFGATAAEVLFDPDGSYGGRPLVTVQAIDWQQDSFIAQNGQTAIRNFIADPNCLNNSCDMTVRTHAVANGFSNSSGIVNIAGLNQTIEYTMVASFTETVTAVSNGAGGPFIPGTSQNVQANFQVDTTKPIFLEIFFDPDVNSGGPIGNPSTQADPLNGYGYNDGDLIAKATLIADSQGNFTVNDVNVLPTRSLDETVTPSVEYNGQLTVQGGGSQTQAIDFGGLTQDDDFFRNQLSNFGVQYQNVSVLLPFGGVLPSDCATVAVSGQAANATTDGSPYACNPDDHVQGLMALNAGTAAAGGYNPSIGDVNGLAFDTFGAGFTLGPDFMAQTDINMNLEADAGQVPLPGSLILLGTGLSALGFLGGTRKRKVS